MRYITALLLVVLSTSGLSQSCEPSPTTRKVLEKLEIPDNERLPLVRRQEIRLGVIRAALASHPDDIHLNEVYQAALLARAETDRTTLLAEFEQDVFKNRQNPVFLYLAANVEIGRKTNEAITHLNRAIELAPNFGLPHLLLAQIYSAGLHEDPAKVNEHVQRFAALCPVSVRTLPSLKWSKDIELIKIEAKRLRKNVETRTDSEAVAAYPVLWSLEAALNRSDQQGENQAQLRSDVDRLFHPEFVRNSAWLDSISQAGDFIEGAQDNLSRKAQQEVATLYAESAAARGEDEKIAKGDDRYPRQASPEQITAYWSRTWHAMLPVARKWPASPSPAFEAARAVILDRNTTPEEIAPVVALFQKSNESDPMSFQLLPPASISIAQWLVDRGGPYDAVADLVSSGFVGADRYLAAETSDNLNEATRTSITSDNDFLYVMGYLPLAEAYLHLAVLPKANEALAQADLKLDSLRPKKNASSSETARYAELAAQYWFVRGLQAEAEKRKVDALVDYRNALSLYPPRRPSPDRRDEVMASAKRLWKDVGGTTRGWNDWAAQSSLASFSAGSGETDAWSKLTDLLPNQLLKDSLGNSWNPKELAKKTTFITMWASWCLPCRAELPYVEKLYQRFHGNDDVVVLAFNVDEDPKAMTQALSELKLSIPSVAARDFAYSVVPEMALPANWIITPTKVEMFQGSDMSHDIWLKEAAAAIEKAASVLEQKSQ